MPVLMIVGPEGSGKTSLFQALRGRVPAVFVPSIKLTVDALPGLRAISERGCQLWALLPTADQLYVADRHPLVDSVAYALYRCESTPEYRVPYDSAAVLLDEEPAVLAARATTLEPVDFAEMRRCYESACSKFKCRTMMGGTVDARVCDTLRFLKELSWI